MSKTLKITKDYKGLKDIGWAYELQGDLFNDEGSIEIDLGNKYLKVTGSISAKFSIKAGWGIKAGSGIKAGDGIEAGSGIVSGLYIICKGVLSVGYRIFAGTATYRKEVTKDNMLIQATKVLGEVVHGNVVLFKEEVTKETCNGKVVEIDGKKYKLTELE